jgi:small basic protein
MVVLASLGIVFGRLRLHWSGLFFCLVGSLRGFFFFSLSLVGLVWVMPRRAVDLYAYG